MYYKYIYILLVSMNIPTFVGTMIQLQSSMALEIPSISQLDLPRNSRHEKL